MAGAPRFKVYDAEGRYQAACKEPEAAAAVVSIYGDGATIRNSHAKVDIVWTEGGDGAANESWDHVAETVHRRIKTNQELRAKRR